MSKKSITLKASKYKPNPRGFGQLIQIYFDLKELSTVISKLSSNVIGLPVECTYKHLLYRSSDLLELHQEQARLEALAKSLIMKLQLPRWNELNQAHKYAVKVSAMGENPAAAFITINLGKETVKRAFSRMTTRGGVQRLGEALKAILKSLGMPTTVTMTLELAPTRPLNPAEHLHCIIYAEPYQYPSVIAALNKTLSKGYISHASNRAVLCKPVYASGKLSGYISKDLLKVLPYDSNRSFASYDTVTPAKALYEDFRKWCKELMKEPIKKKIPVPSACTRYPSTRPKSSSGIQELVAQKLLQIEKEKLAAAAKNREIREARKRSQGEKTRDFAEFKAWLKDRLLLDHQLASNALTYSFSKPLTSPQEARYQ